MLRTFRVGLVILLLAGCGGSQQLSPLPRDAVILAFGDSLTYGTGASRSSSYPSVLAQMTGYKVINAGVPGEVTAVGLQRLPGMLEAHDPDLVVLIHGGNDMLRRQNRAAAAKNIEAMIALIRERNAQVVMLGVPQPGLILSTADFYEQVAESTATPIDADALADILQYASNKSDTVHPNASGYRMLAEAVHELLEDNGALTR